MIFLGIVIVIIGLIMTMNPTFVWWVTQSWKTDGGEPSRLYVFSTRFGGITMTLVGIGGIVASYLSKR